MTTPSRIAMNTFELNRRQALFVGGMGALSLGMPGMVMGNDKLDASGKAVAAEQTEHRFQRVADQVCRAAGLLCAEYRHRRLYRLGLGAGLRRLGKKPSGDGQLQTPGNLRPGGPGPHG